MIKIVYCQKSQVRWFQLLTTLTQSIVRGRKMNPKIGQPFVSKTPLNQLEKKYKYTEISRGAKIPMIKPMIDNIYFD